MMIFFGWSFVLNYCINNLGGGFKDFLFSALFGEMIQFDKNFSDGLKPPTRECSLMLQSLL